MLKDDPFIADSAGDALLVKVFKQWNGVFAGYAKQVFKSRNVDLSSFGFVRCHKLPQALQSRLVKDQIIRQFDEHAVAEQESDQFLRSGLVNALEFEQISEAFLYLSRIRNLISLLGLTTDVIPENPDKLDRLARVAGAESGYDFHRRHEETIGGVRAIYLEGLERLGA